MAQNLFQSGFGSFQSLAEANLKEVMAIPGYETEEKAQTLKPHATERGMLLPTEVVDYCLRYLRRDLPTLMTTLDALDEWSLTEKKPITVPMLRKLLQLNLEL